MQLHKAPEGGRIPRRFARFGVIVSRASVFDAARPLPLVAVVPIIFRASSLTGAKDFDNCRSEWVGDHYREQDVSGEFHPAVQLM
jgi:hypothetical protein